jgi:hypothetical protein
MPERPRLSRWILALVAVALLILGWTIATNMDSGEPNDASPMIMDKP